MKKKIAATFPHTPKKVTTALLKIIREKYSAITRQIAPNDETGRPAFLRLFKPLR